ncbi:MAG: YsnF/AvaK domain-containing protein [Chloroflexi bacterium]|nr:YsnF/AvaK domain-containing protein [Chloroflexota bacterium]
MQSSYYTQVHEGMEVLDTNGDKIGMCGESVGNYFNVDAGFLGTTEYWVPFSAITNVTGGAIFLNTTKDRIDTMGWNQRPEMTGTPTTEDSQRTVQLREEELQARKTAVQTGSVHLGKDVVEEQRTMDVPVTREEVYVERHPVDRRPSDRPISESDSETIRVPVTEEHVEVEKQPVVYEEVGVGKRVTQETREVSDTVRREELRMDHEGDVEVHKDNP